MEQSARETKEAPRANDGEDGVQKRDTKHVDLRGRRSRSRSSYGRTYTLAEHRSSLLVDMHGNVGGDDPLATPKPTMEESVADLHRGYTSRIGTRRGLLQTAKSTTPLPTFTPPPGRFAGRFQRQDDTAATETMQVDSAGNGSDHNTFEDQCWNLLLLMSTTKLGDGDTSLLNIVEAQLDDRSWENTWFLVFQGLYRYCRRGLTALAAKIDDKRRNDAAFTGRDRVFDEVRAWLAEDGNAVEKTFVVTGGAGVGKSAFVAELCDNEWRGLAGQVAAVHLCCKCEAASLSVAEFVWGLVESLCDSVDGFVDHLLEGEGGGGGGSGGGSGGGGCDNGGGEGGSSFATLGEWKVATFADKPASYILQYVLLPILHEMPIPAPAPLLLCIDSLDEALLVPGGASKSIAALVFSAGVSAGWPTWLRILVTSRPHVNVLSLLPRRSRRVDLTVGSHRVQPNKADIRHYVEGQCLHELIHKAERDIHYDDVVRVVGWSDVSLLGGFVDAICAKSEGTFLYAKMALDGIKANGGLPSNGDELDQLLPVGLDGIFNDQFRRQFPRGNEKARKHYIDEVLPTLEVLAASFAAVPGALLVEAALPQRSRANQDRVLAQVAMFCRPGKGEQSTKGRGGGGEPGESKPTANENKRTTPYALFPRSLSDWITNKEQSELYFADIGKGHERLAERTLEMADRGIAAVGRGHNKSGSLAHFIPQPPRRDVASDAYLLKYGLRHLVAAKRLGDAARVFCDMSWLMTRCEMLPANETVAEGIWLARELSETIRGHGGFGIRAKLQLKVNRVHEAVGVVSAVRLVARCLEQSLGAIMNDHRQLPSQIVGRLADGDYVYECETVVPLVAGLVAAARKWSFGKGVRWWCPATRCLAWPGGALRKNLRGVVRSGLTGPGSPRGVKTTRCGCGTRRRGSWRWVGRWKGKVIG